MPFGDPHVETAFRHFAQEDVHRTAGRHGGSHTYDPGVPAGQFQQRLAEDILIARRIGRSGNPLAGIGIEAPRSMPDRLVVLGRKVAFSLHGHNVQQFGALDVAQRTERPHQLFEVVAVHGPEVTEIETFEEVALVQQALFHGVARLLAEPQQTRRMRQNAPQPLFETVVVDRSRNFQQVVFQRPGGLVDGHVVVVQDHQQVRALRGPGVVEPLESQPAGHRTVADDGHHLPLLAPQFGRLGHAESRGDRHRGVTAPESVVFALGHARKAADAVQPALGPERLAASGDDLVGVGLVADIPDDLVLRGFEDIMQRRGQLHGPEARSQVPRVDRTLVDDIASQLVAVNAQLLRRELLQLPRRRDRIEQFIFFRRHKDCKDRKKNERIQNRITPTYRLLKGALRLRR